jgi:hypothetical protein
VIASFSDYLPFGDLVKILAVCLVVAAVAPTAVAVGIVGLDRRAQARQAHAGGAVGTALVLVGVGVLAALVGLGIYALVNH